MANKTAHKAKMRSKILEEASYALRSSGLNGVSVAGLMKRAGLTHGGFYAYYRTRDDLVADAVATMFEGTGRMLDRCLMDRPAKEGLGAFLDFYLSEDNVRKIEKGCAIPALSSEVTRMPTEARNNFENGVRMFESRLAGALEAAGIAAAKSMARVMLAQMVGAVTLARSIEDTDASLAIVDAARADLKQRLELH